MLSRWIHYISNEDLVLALPKWNLKAIGAYIIGWCGLEWVVRGARRVYSGGNKHWSDVSELHHLLGNFGNLQTKKHPLGDSPSSFAIGEERDGGSIWCSTGNCSSTKQSMGSFHLWILGIKIGPANSSINEMKIIIFSFIWLFFLVGSSHCYWRTCTRSEACTRICYSFEANAWLPVPWLWNRCWRKRKSWFDQGCCVFVVFVIYFFSKVVGSVLELPDTERIIEELIASHDGASSISENSKTCNEEKKTR